MKFGIKGDEYEPPHLLAHDKADNVGFGHIETITSSR